eukprot:scaffold230_cov353-Prasinococcus_capsulatus_cf.AAC.8
MNFVKWDVGSALPCIRVGPHEVFPLLRTPAQSLQHMMLPLLDIVLLRYTFIAETLPFIISIISEPLPSVALHSAADACLALGIFLVKYPLLPLQALVLQELCYPLRRLKSPAVAN